MLSVTNKFMGFESFNPPVESNENNLEAAEQRFRKAEEALGKVGPEKFPELLEQGDEVAIEYAEALQAYEKALGSNIPE